jgi:thiol-disulfide isomerase/thioredoxin
MGQVDSGLRKNLMATSMTDPGDGDAAALAAVRTESGASLLELEQQSPVLLVFLRHFGCSFCRKAISDVAELGSELAQRGVRPVFVHLGPPELAKVYFEYYRLNDVERINDPEAVVYKLPIFGLGRKNPFLQAFNPTVLAGWFKGALFKHGIGMIQGDGHQMPGVFYLKGATVVRSFRYKTIADEPNYLKLIG